MKRYMLVGLMIGLVFLGGCRTVDEARVKLLKDEIAGLGSMAQVSGPRTELQIYRIQADVTKVIGHVDEVVK